MKRAQAFASTALVLTILARTDPGIAGVEEILIDGEAYALLRLSDDETREKVASFNGELERRNLAGRIVQCAPGLVLSPGTGQGDPGLGAYCILQMGAWLATVVVCADQGLGRIAMEAVDLTRASKTNLATFVRRNCSGG